MTLAAFSPVFGQRSGQIERVSRTENTVFDSVRALTDGNGVLVRWQMRTEKAVSAYDVYRITTESKEKITETMVAGSAARFGERVAYGEAYNFFDLEGSLGAVYVVEGLLLNGRRFQSKPISVSPVQSIEAEVGISSATFAQARLSKNSNVEARSVSLSGELQDLVSLYTKDPDIETQRWVAKQPGAKIAIRKDGFYRVSAVELANANFPIGSDSTKWRLFMEGNEQAINVGPGGSYIEFYGRGHDTPETDTRIYYLVSDTTLGKRIAQKRLRQIPGAAEAFNYPVVAGKKERVFFDNRAFNGERENFFGSIFNDTPALIPFALSGVDPSVANAKIRVQCFGFTNNPHSVTAKLNGHDIGGFTQFGRVYFWGEFTVPTSHLQDGQNVLELRSNASGDQVLFDYVEISYDRDYVADADKISFSTPGYKKVDIDGFSTSGIRVFDLTFDGEPTQIIDVPVVETTQGFRLKLPSGRPMVGYAFENGALLQAPSVVENAPSTLSAATNEAEMIILSHGSTGFIEAAENWAQYRRSAAGGELDTKVINVTDVFDEFSYGAIRADAIKEFFEYITDEWATAPNYILLIGDSTYDPRNYEGFGNFYMLPSKQVTLILEEGFSDEALGDFDDDGLSQIAIGRIPARTVGQIQTALTKTMRYEANQQSLDRGALFIYDNPVGFDFENMSQQLAGVLPPATPRVFVGVMEQNATQTVVSELNQGKFVVNYSGHGSSGIIANSSFFTINTVPQLTNAQNPSVFTMLTCLTGFFLRTNGTSLSESLLFSESGGAAAAWASTSETTPDIQLLMGLRFYDEIGDGSLSKTGDMIKYAKEGIPAGADVRLSWVLIGDPALKMP